MKASILCYRRRRKGEGRKEGCLNVSCLYSVYVLYIFSYVSIFGRKERKKEGRKASLPGRKRNYICLVYVYNILILYYYVCYSLCHCMSILVLSSYGEGRRGEGREGKAEHDPWLETVAYVFSLQPLLTIFILYAEGIHCCIITCACVLSAQHPSTIHIYVSAC